MDELVDKIIAIIKDTPQKRVEYMCHGDYHSYLTNDLDAIRIQLEAAVKAEKEEKE